MGFVTIEQYFAPRFLNRYARRDRGRGGGVVVTRRAGRAACMRNAYHRYWRGRYRWKEVDWIIKRDTTFQNKLKIQKKWATIRSWKSRNRNFRSNIPSIIGWYSWLLTPRELQREEERIRFQSGIREKLRLHATKQEIRLSPAGLGSCKNKKLGISEGKRNIIKFSFDNIKP